MELIDKFLAINGDTVQSDFFLNPDTNAVEPVNGDKSYDVKLGRKQIALKILSVNMASHLRWDLTSMEKNWNLQKQIQLLEDLCTITSGKSVTIPMKKAPALGPLGNKMAFDFALFVYHRWILRVFKIFKDLIQKKKAVEANVAAGGQPEINFSLRDEMFIQVMDPEPQASVEYLIGLCTAAEQKRIPILTATSIAPLTTNSEPSAKGFRFEKSVSAVEVRAQIYFDLCQYFLYNNSHDLAKKYVILCRENFHQLQAEYKQKGSDTNYLICDIDEAELNGVLLACGASALPDSLMQRFNNFVMNRGDDLIEILKADNVAREIPFVQRKIIELDMEATSLINPGKTKEILKSIVALNTIRSVVGPETVMSGSDFLGQFQSDEDFSYFSIFIQQYLKESTRVLDKQLIGAYVMNAITGKESITPALNATLKKLDLISEEALVGLKKKTTALPEIAKQTEWVVPETNRECYSTSFFCNILSFPYPFFRTTHREEFNHEHKYGEFQAIARGVGSS